MPRVTVFIPTYNRARLLPEAIKSVLGQTYDDFRLVVSDNASDDSTPEIVASFDDPRLEYVRQPENLGLLGNHNWFLQRIETDYALILPDDDLVYPGALERSVAELDRLPRAGVVHADFDVIDENGSVLLPHTNWTYGLHARRGRDRGRGVHRRVDEVVVPDLRVDGTDAGGGDPGGRDRRQATSGDRLRDVAAHGVRGLGVRVHRRHARRLPHPRRHPFRRIRPAPKGPGYIQGTEIVSRLKEVKRHFVETHADKAGR